MKEFLRSMLGSCMGVIVAMLLVVIFVFGLGAALSMGEKTAKTSENGILKLTLNYPIPEKTDNVQAGFGTAQASTLGLRHILRLLDHAAKDENIKGIVINASSMEMGQASLLQLRKAIMAFRESGKFVYAFADSYSQSAYFLSSAADSVFLNPNGDVGLQGFGVLNPYFKGTMDKLGIDFDIFYAGDFKSATEPFRRTDMSPENRLQTREFLNDMIGLMKSEVSKSRGITVAEIDRIMSELDGRDAPRCLQNKLVDATLYWDEFEQKVRKAAEVKQDEKINYLSLDDYNALAGLTEEGKYSKKVAVVYAEGEVVYNMPSKGVIDNTKYLKIFDKIRNDKNIKAVVLRVNSGGGSALTSDIIWREVELLKEKGIPVIASFGDYAASGGYYIAAGADSIYAAPNTLTGSIGVFSMLPNFKKLANEKMGITFDTVKTHELAVNLSTVMELTDKERQYLTESTNDIYKKFLKRVADGRKMPVDTIHKYAQGRVWTGRKAKEIGLVDEIGYLNDAIAAAAKKAGIEDYKVVEYPRIEKSMLEQLVEGWARQQGEEGEAIRMNAETRWLLKLYKENKAVWLSDGIQARMLLQPKFD